MSAVRPMPMPTPRWSVDYVHTTPEEALAHADTLAVIGFGHGAPEHDDPRYLRVALEPFGTAPLEVWRGSGPVLRGRDGDVARAEDGALQFGEIELDEREGPHYEREFWIRDRGRFLRVPVADVERIEAERDYVRLYWEGRTLLHRETMSHLEEKLDPNVMLRVHRSAFVNWKRLKAVRRDANGRLID